MDRFERRGLRKSARDLLAATFTANFAPSKRRDLSPRFLAEQSPPRSPPPESSLTFQNESLSLSSLRFALNFNRADTHLDTFYSRG